MNAENQPLYRTATGERRHVRNCPHLIGKEVLEAADTDGEICDWCIKELRGEGRQYFGTLDEALRALGGPQGKWPLIREHLACVAAEEVWIPFSRSYIALGRNRRAVARAGKTYVEHPAGRYIELPGFRAGSGGGAARQEIPADICQKHNLEKARNGACGMCFD